jgi:hypothetical protein
VACLLPTHALTLGYNLGLESKAGSVEEGCIGLGAGGRAGLIGKGPYPQFPQSVSLVIIRVVLK